MRPVFPGPIRIGIPAVYAGTAHCILNPGLDIRIPSAGLRLQMTITISRIRKTWIGINVGVVCIRPSALHVAVGNDDGVVRIMRYLLRRIVPEYAVDHDSETGI